METSFATAMRLVREFEGGYVDDPDDPGGATFMGVALNRLGRVLGIRTKHELKQLTVPEVSRYFKAHYWAVSRCGDLPEGIDLFVFDAAINQGNRASGRFLQRSVNRMGPRRKLVVDGRIGPATVAEITEVVGGTDAMSPHPERLERLIWWLVAHRCVHYSSLTKVAKYGVGWFRRVGAATCEATKLIHNVGD